MGCRSAGRLSKRIMDDCGRARTCPAAPAFNSPCRRLQTLRRDAALVSQPKEQVIRPRVLLSVWLCKNASLRGLDRNRYFSGSRLATRTSSSVVDFYRSEENHSPRFPSHGVFTQPGSLATESGGQQARPCPRCSREARASHSNAAAWAAYSYGEGDRYLAFYQSGFSKLSVFASDKGLAVSIPEAVAAWPHASSNRPDLRNPRDRPANRRDRLNRSGCPSRRARSLIGRARPGEFL